MTRLRTPPPPSWGETHAMLAKASKGRESTVKAESQPNTLPAVEESRGAWAVDDYGIGGFNVLGTHSEKTDPYGWAFTDAHKRMMARFAIAAVLLERIIAEIERFGIRQTRPGAPGHQIRLRDAKRPPTKIEEQVIEELYREVEFCGVLKNREERFYRDDFRTYLRKAATDSLILDKVLTEFPPDKNGQPARFLALDAELGRFAVEKDTGYRYPVMVGHMRLGLLAEWKPGDPHRAFLGIRRPQTITAWRGYGHSELEDAWQVLQGLSRGMEHNLRFFESGLSAAGVMVLHDKTNPQMVNSLKRWAESTMLGSRNNRRVAFFGNGGDKPVQWLPFSDATMKDMEFANFMNFMLKLFCAFYRTDPMLVNFQFGEEGGGGKLSTAGPDTRLDYGRNQGILSVARFLIESIDQFYFQQKYPEFELVIGGLDDDDAKERNERDKEELQWRGVNEIRADRDHKPLDLTKITNPAEVPTELLQTWLQMHTAMGTFGGSSEADAAQASANAEADVQAQAGKRQPDNGPMALDLDKLLSEAKAEGETPLVKSLMAYIDRGVRSGSILALDAP